MSIAQANCLRLNSTLTAIDLAGNALGWQGAESLAKGLKENKGVTALDLRKNLLTRDKQQGVIALAGALSFNKALTFIDLSSNFIADESASGMAALLHLNSNLTDLRLMRNDISPDGVPHIATALSANRTLAFLDLRANDMRKRGVKALLKVLLDSNESLMQICTIPIRYLQKDKVRKLDMRGMGLGVGEAVILSHSLKFNRRLKELHLEDNQIREDYKQNLRDCVFDESAGEPRIKLTL
jgi:Ran GTPase-activating protein (RanGAP) involved in mRNA processing and transport